jgi:hypothetical protein
MVHHLPVLIAWYIFRLPSTEPTQYVTNARRTRTRANDLQELY